MPDVHLLKALLDTFPSFAFPVDDILSSIGLHGGAVSDFDHLLDDLEVLRRLDLGDTAPGRLADTPFVRIGGDEASPPEFSLCRAYRNGKSDPVAEVEAAIAKIEEAQETTHVFIATNYEMIRCAALEARERMTMGRTRPLEGVLFAVKDMFRARGYPTTAGARGAPPVDKKDAASVSKLRHAGALLLGKTNLAEWSYSITGENRTFGTVPHPADRTRLAGGSSSGSAAAVALGLAAFALGTDTGGSVRVPATLCGLVGLKPTFGLVPCCGVIPFSWTLDHVGIIASSVPDSAAVLEVLAANNSPLEPKLKGRPNYTRDRTTPSIDCDLTVGVCREWAVEEAESEAVAGMEMAARTLLDHGAKLREVRLSGFEQTRTVSLVLQLAEALSYHGLHLERHPNDFSNDVRGGLLIGQFLLAEHYVRAQRMVRVYTRRLDEILMNIDVLLMPATPIEAPLIGSKWAEAAGRRGPVGDVLTRFTTLFNITGHPAVVVPAGTWSSGLPKGVQLVGRRGEDRIVLHTAALVESTLR